MLLITASFPSGLFRRHNDDTRVLRELHCGIQGPHQAVLHDTGHSHWAPAVSTDVSLHRGGRRVGWQFRLRHLRLGGDLFVSRPTLRAPFVNVWGSHGFSLSTQ
jgi:hypothetical protein